MKSTPKPRFSIEPFLIALCVTFTLAACSDARNSESFAQDRALLADGWSPGSNVDPCSIALSLSEGSTVSDQIADSIRRVGKEPYPVSALERLGWTYVDQARSRFDDGLYLLAEQTAACIEQQSPGSSEALLLRGHVLHNLHRFKEAEALAQELVKQRGLWFDQALLGDVLLEQGRLEAAAAAYQIMADQKPGPSSYIRVARLRWLTGDLQGAIELAKMAAAGSGGRRHPEATAWIHSQLAGYQLQANAPLHAKHSIDTALALYPDYPPALMLRAQVSMREESWEVSITDLRRAVEQSPLPEYRWWLAEALEAGGHADAARQMRRELLRRGDEDPRTLALFLATHGEQTNRAVRLTRRELTARQDVFTLDALAWALHRAGNHAEAYRLSRRVAESATEDARLDLHIGLIAAAAGEHEEARIRLARAHAVQHRLLPTERELLRTEPTEL